VILAKLPLDLLDHLIRRGSKVLPRRLGRDVGVLARGVRVGRDLGAERRERDLESPDFLEPSGVNVISNRLTSSNSDARCSQRASIDWRTLSLFGISLK